MEDKNKDCVENKKLSKRYLAFYIIGLFSVALVIILLSYLTQLQADRDLANMNSALQQKDSTMQGVQEKLVALQNTVKEQAERLDEADKQLSGVRDALRAEEQDDLSAEVQQLVGEHDAYQQLAQLEHAAAVQDTQTAKSCIDYLERTYGAGRLDGTAANAVLIGTHAERYLALKAQYV